MMIWKKKEKIVIIDNYASYDKKILISKKQFVETEYQRLKKHWLISKNNLIDSNNNMYLKIGSLIKISNLILGSHNVTLRKVHVKPYGFDKMYIDKYKLFQIIDQFNERKITSVNFYQYFQKYIYSMMRMVECVRYCLLMMIKQKN